MTSQKNLYEFYITRLCRIRRKLQSSINKISNRQDIYCHVKDNHIQKMKNIDISLDSLELEVADLQHTINKYLNTDRTISLDMQNDISNHQASDEMIKKFLPYMLIYYMNLNTSSDNNTSSSHHIDVNELDELDGLD
jgi:hypothetical protein